ncbi:hypothetical protein [Ectobacillus panaciterrae]|uniref:hypothetical protein n=1 Tax=Ectobacillus panaciterrae TaxID=363872 RepID=UPI000490D68A|nr:hypothetical protein [Ectobacillus panaciterrae]
MAAVLIISTACLLSYSICKLFLENAFVSYIPSLLYMFGGAYFLMLFFMGSGKMGEELRIWALILIGAALGSFFVSAWLQYRREQ